MGTERAGATRPLQQLDPLEVHSGIAFGPWRGPGRPEPPDVREHPRKVLEGILVDALSGAPCHVLFSGGRDSSVILAAATDVARRHGLPEPIPLTTRFPESPTTWEDDWQERTVRHLGLKDWVREDVTDELDTLGPMAADTIRRFGVYWPSGAHNVRHHAQVAGGGTILTGGGGDELFSPWPLRRVPLRLVVRRRPRRRVPMHVATHVLPGRARRRVLARRLRANMTAPWLRPEAAEELQARWDSQDFRSESWRAATHGMLPTRYRQLVGSAMHACAAIEGARLIEPFAEADFIVSVANFGPREGFLSRGRALEALFADLLPREVLYRSTKAAFNDATFGPSARAFARSWDGSGVDDRLVQPELLFAEWAKEHPNVRSIACLHQAWLHAQDAH